VSLTLCETTICQMDYSIICHKIETKLPSNLLDEWKEFIFTDLRSKKLWDKDQSSEFSQKIFLISNTFRFLIL
jgi:hypothetical protein